MSRKVDAERGLALRHLDKVSEARPAQFLAQLPKPKVGLQSAITSVMILITFGLIGTFVLLQQPYRGTTLPVMAVASPVCGTWHVTLSTATAYDVVKAISKDEVWFAGASGFARWDGRQQNVMAGPDWGKERDLVNIEGLAVLAKNDAWAVGYSFQGGQNGLITVHWDGDAWTLVPTPDLPPNSVDPLTRVPKDYTKLSGVTIISANDVWAVGSYDEVGRESTLTLHWDGNKWNMIPSPNVGGDDNYLNTVVSLSGDEVLAFGGTRTGPEAWDQQPLVLRWNGGSWEIANRVPKLSHGIISASLTPSKDIWIIDGEAPLGSAFMKTGTDQWSAAAMPEIDLPILSSVVAISSDDVWAIGSKWSDYPQDAKDNQRATRSLVIHWDGTEWREVPDPNPSYIQSLEGIDAVSRDDIWVVGSSADDEDGPGREMIAHFVGCSNK